MNKQIFFGIFLFLFPHGSRFRCFLVEVDLAGAFLEVDLAGFFVEVDLAGTLLEVGLTGFGAFSFSLSVLSLITWANIWLSLCRAWNKLIS